MSYSQVVKLFLVFVAPAFVLAGCLNPSVPTEATAIAAPTPTILALGDSVTAGTGVRDRDNYPSQLASRLSEGGYAYDVVNAGYNGATTADLLTELDATLADHQPEIVILEIGGNDLLQRVPVPVIEENLRHIIARIRLAGVSHIILAGLVAPPKYDNAYLTDFSAIFPRLAVDENVTLVPSFMEGVLGNRDFTGFDKIHPNRAGYQLIVEHLLPYLVPALSKTAIVDSAVESHS